MQGCVTIGAVRLDVESKKALDDFQVSMLSSKMQGCALFLPCWSVESLATKTNECFDCFNMSVLGCQVHGRPALILGGSIDGLAAKAKEYLDGEDVSLLGRVVHRHWHFSDSRIGVWSVDEMPVCCECVNKLEDIAFACSIPNNSCFLSSSSHFFYLGKNKDVRH